MSAAGVVFGLGIGGVALALMLAKRATKSKPKSGPELPKSTAHREPLTKPIHTPQTPAEVEELLRIACRCVFTAPELSDETLAKCIWINAWPDIPDPVMAVEGDHATVVEALAAVKVAIASARSGECDDLPDLGPKTIEIDPEKLAPFFPFGPIPFDPDGAGPFGPIPFDPDGAGPFGPIPAPPDGPGETDELDELDEADEADEQPELVGPVDMAALTRETPTPGYFYQVREGDLFLGDRGIVARALRQAVLEAAAAMGLSPTRAQSLAATLAADAKARAAYLNIIQCSPWNDALYATWGYGKNAVPAAHGRAIRLVPKHDQVYDRLADGQPPVRTLDRGAPADKGTGSATGAGDAYELLWLPPLRADALLDLKRQNQVVADGLVWPGGLSKYSPPIAVQILGILDAPPGPFGCGGLS